MQHCLAGSAWSLTQGPELFSLACRSASECECLGEHTCSRCSRLGLGVMRRIVWPAEAT